MISECTWDNETFCFVFHGWSDYDPLDDVIADDSYENTPCHTLNIRRASVPLTG